ncbi:MAG: restriction endonuclease subunit S [Fusobacterium periodonticum]|nr:restriction endonuclease subunit S [Fusobacterium periodonticum]
MKIFNKNEWKKVKLGDVCDLRNGVAIKSEDYIINSNTLNCRMSNIRPDGTFDILYNAKYLPDNFSEKYKNYLLKNGDLVIAMTDMAGDPKILGVPTVVKSNGFNIIQNQRVGKLELLTDNIDENYLKFALQSKNVKNYFKKFSAGGVQLNLSKKEILNAPIVLPTIEEQKILVNLFKTIESFIYLRKKELLNLNSLNKSLFTKYSIGEKESIANLCYVKARIGWQGLTKKEYLSNGEYYLITGVDFKNEKIDFKNCFYVTKERYNQDENIKVKINDILLTKDGTIGKVAIVDKLEKPATLNSGVFVLRPKVNNLNVTYLMHSLISEDFKKFIDDIKIGATVPHLNQAALLKYKLILPPIELQNKFAERIEKITKLSFEIEEAIKEAENLYNSLISKYFD